MTIDQEKVVGRDITSACTASTESLEHALRATPWFTGDPKRATDLLRQFIAGIQWVRSQVAKQGITIAPQEICLCREALDASGKPVEDIPSAFVSAGKIYVSAKELAEMSKVPPTVIGTLQRQTAIIFTGTPAQYYFLVGVEEADHVRYNQQHGLHASLMSKDTVPVAQYDAQQHEFESLEMVLRAAQDLRFPEITTAVIRERLRLAGVLKGSPPA